jgi:lipopolysaccharide transport system ATP-binding protein
VKGGPFAPQLRLQGVHKDYPLALANGGQRLAQVWALLRGNAPQRVFHALHDVSFDVQRGESLGLVGVNGAGKSTLLKVLAGVVTPSRGTIERNARVGALLELGAGFHLEYSGRDNVFLACALMGLSRKETLERLDGILAFADIGEHIDQPIKHYSSGMVVRLGFAVATSVTPDVLITDEVLAVGDESFQKKCMTWMERFLEGGGTLLLCSHSMYHVQKMCRHAIWLHEGRLRMHDTAAEVTRAYLAWHEERDRAAKTGPPAAEAGAAPAAAGIYQVRTMFLNGSDPAELLRLPPRGSLTVTGALYSPDGRTPQVAVGVVRADGSPVYGIVSEMDRHTLTAGPDGLFHYAITFPDLPLLPGRYVARSHALDPEGLRLFDHVERPFEVGGDSREFGHTALAHRWHDDPLAGAAR